MSSRERKWRHPDGVGLKRMARSTEEMTIEDAVDWLLDVIGKDGYEAVVSAGIFVDWYSPMTQEERDANENAKAVTKERTDKWERETYERLHEKYGPAPGKGF